MFEKEREKEKEIEGEREREKERKREREKGKRRERDVTCDFIFKGGHFDFVSKRVQFRCPPII